MPDPNDSTANANLAREISKEIESNPNEADAYFRRGMVYSNTRYLNRAEADFISALAIDSSKADYYFHLGKVQYAMNQTKNAADAYEKAILLDPNHQEAKLKLADLYFLVKEHQKSIDLFNNLIKQDKGNAYLYHMLGMNYKETGDTARAIYHFQTAVETDPTDYESTLYIANLYASQKKEVALDYFTAALKIRPNSTEVNFARAFYLQQTGRFKEAVEDYKKVVSADPTNYLAFYNVGYINYEAGFTDKAINNWKTVIKLNPEYANAYYMLGLVYEEKKMLKEAAENYKVALALDPNNPLFREAKKRNNL